MAGIDVNFYESDFFSFRHLDWILHLKSKACKRRTTLKGTLSSDSKKAFVSKKSFKILNPHNLFIYRLASRDAFYDVPFELFLFENSINHCMASL